MDAESTTVGYDYGSSDDENENHLLTLNDEVITQLKHNDPSVTSVKIIYSDVSNVDWGYEGSCISDNIHLEELSVERGRQTLSIHCIEFFRAIARNRSIQKLSVSCDYIIDAVAILSPFIEQNTNLCKITLWNMGDRGAEQLAYALSNCPNKLLQGVDLNFDFDVGYESSAKVLTALGSYHNLVEISLSSSVGGRDGCIVIGNLLQCEQSNLKKLSIFSCEDLDDECIEILSTALSKNSSLKLLECGGRNSMSYGGIGLLHFARSLKHHPSLKELYLDDLEFDDETASVLTNSLARMTTVKKITLYEHGMSPIAWLSFFSCLLQKLNTSLEYLSVKGAGMNDEGATYLSNALAKNITLQTLDLSFGHFSTVGAVALGGALFTSKTLKTLDLRYNSCRGSIIGTAGWNAIFSGLSNPESALEDLRLHEAGIDEGSLVTLASALATNRSLKKLDISDNRGISNVGWVNFFSLMPCNLLEELTLAGNNIDDTVVPTMVSKLTNHCLPLKKLGLSRTEITSVGWRGVSTLLDTSTLNLEEITFGHHNVNANEFIIDDETIISFTNGLVNNTNLKALKIHYVKAITERGWTALANLLCNNSTIDSTFLSNHTLEYIYYPDQDNELPNHIVSLLRLNRENDRAGAARLKILRHHFSEGASMQLFVDMDMGILPSALAWAGRDNDGHNLLYQMIKSSVPLFD